MVSGNGVAVLLKLTGALGRVREPSEDGSVQSPEPVLPSSFRHDTSQGRWFRIGALCTGIGAAACGGRVGNEPVPAAPDPQSSPASVPLAIVGVSIRFRDPRTNQPTRSVVITNVTRKDHRT